MVTQLVSHALIGQLPSGTMAYVPSACLSICVRADAIRSTWDPALLTSSNARLVVATICAAVIAPSIPVVVARGNPSSSRMPASQASRMSSTRRAISLQVEVTACPNRVVLGPHPVRTVTHHQVGGPARAAAARSRRPSQPPAAPRSPEACAFAARASATSAPE